MNSQINQKSKKRFSCNACGKTYAGNFNLKDHIRIVHEGKRDFRCDLCEKTFGRRETMKTHLALVHGKVEINDESLIRTEKKYSCKFCEKSYTQPHNLKSHMESCRHMVVEEIDSKSTQNDMASVYQGISTGNGNGSYLPNVANNSVKSHKDSNQILIENIDKIRETKAEIMDFVNDVEMKYENFDLDQSQDASIKNVHEGAKSSNSSTFDQFEIKLEATTFNKNNESPNYSEMISQKKPNDFVPNFNITSNINYINENAFQNEIKPSAKKYPCKQCDKSYTWNFLLKNHVKTIHENLREFGCDQPDCNSNFGRRATLMTHLMLVHGIVATKDKNETKHARKYRCKNCDKGYTTSTNLKLHMKNVHEGKNTMMMDEQFTCKNCKIENMASFNSKELLQLHMLQYHSDE